MFFVHEVHALEGGREAHFESTLRQTWAPALAAQPGVRLAWCVRSMPGTASFPELITLTAVADGPTLERLGERLRTGDLRELNRALDEGRRSVVRRVLAPLDFNPLDFELDALPSAPEPTGDESAMYIHDFVPPRPGQQRAYEVAMGDVFMKMLASEGRAISSWAGFETVAGGGPMEENVMVSLIPTGEAGARLLTTDIPRDYLKPGVWTWDALALRDTWVSRLVRTVPWSPLR